VVSPYTKPGHISHDYADHVSILKFIERNWGLPTIVRPKCIPEGVNALDINGPIGGKRLEPARTPAALGRKLLEVPGYTLRVFVTNLVLPPEEILARLQSPVGHGKPYRRSESSIKLSY
jgi:hypothetical protein